MKAMPSVQGARPGFPGRASLLLPPVPNLGRPLWGVALSLVLLAAAGCEKSSARPDVLLVTIDTLRSDHCSTYGYPVPTTPVLSALATRGVMYRRAYSESSTTAPSHAVLMTGRHFRSLGVDANGKTIPEEAVTLAEAFKEEGYATAAFVSSFPLMTRFGFAQGFDVFDDSFEMKEASIGRRKDGGKPHDRLAEATVARLQRWFEKREDSRPLFLWVHFVDPHAPYKAPEPFDATWPRGTSGTRQRYDAEVRYADKNLGVLLELFARHTPAREELVVVTSDHGEGLGDHGWLSHGLNLYEEAVRVPLVASWPGHLPSGRVEEAPVGIVDIAPGILTALGLETKTFADGRPLFAAPEPQRSVFLERRKYVSGKEMGHVVSGPMTAVVQGESKLIVAPDEKLRELYDLQADPREARNLLGAGEKPAKRSATPPPPPLTGEQKARAEEKARRQDQVLADWEAAFPPAAQDDEPLDKETRKALRALGYVD